MPRLNIKHFFFSRWSRFSIFGVFFILSLLLASSKAFSEELTAKLFIANNNGILRSEFALNEDGDCESPNSLVVVGDFKIDEPLKFTHSIQGLSGCESASKTVYGVAVFSTEGLILDYKQNNSSASFKKITPTTYLLEWVSNEE